MDNTQPETQQPIIHVTTIRITCTCGGMCYTEEGYGTSSIQIFDEAVWCQECGTRYDVPENAFRSTAIFYTQDTSKMSFEDLKDLGDHLASVKSDEAFFRGMNEG